LTIQLKNAKIDLILRNNKTLKNKEDFTERAFIYVK